MLTGQGVASGGRRHAEIKPETDANAVVWAKSPRYPWWPAQVRGQPSQNPSYLKSTY